MQALFTAQYQWLWTLGLVIALFFPLRQFIWVMSVRRTEAKKGKTDAAEQERLKRRAGVTSALLSFVFSFFYVSTLFSDTP